MQGSETPAPRQNSRQILWLIAFVFAVAVASEIFRFFLTATTLQNRHLEQPLLVWTTLLLATHALPSLLLVAWVYSRQRPKVSATGVFVGLGMLLWVAADWSGALSMLSNGYTLPNVPYLYWFAQVLLLVLVGVVATAHRNKRA
jgi:hypothetical protein